MRTKPVLRTFGDFVALAIILFSLFLLGAILAGESHHIVGYLFYVACVLLFGAKALTAGLAIWLLLWFFGPPCCCCTDKPNLHNKGI